MNSDEYMDAKDIMLDGLIDIAEQSSIVLKYYAKQCANGNCDKGKLAAEQLEWIHNKMQETKKKAKRYMD